MLSGVVGGSKGERSSPMTTGMVSENSTNLGENPEANGLHY